MLKMIERCVVNIAGCPALIARLESAPSIIIFLLEFFRPRILMYLYSAKRTDEGGKSL